jgi:hypothetical protein
MQKPMKKIVNLTIALVVLIAFFITTSVWIA